MPVSANTMVAPNCRNPARWRVFVRLSARMCRDLEADTQAFLCDGHKGEPVIIEDTAWKRFEAIFISGNRIPCVPSIKRFVDVVPFLNLGDATVG